MRTIAVSLVVALAYLFSVFAQQSDTTKTPEAPRTREKKSQRHLPRRIRRPRRRNRNPRLQKPRPRPSPSPGKKAMSITT
jgi:hypothetical protein